MSFLGFPTLDGTGSDQLLIPLRATNGSGVISNADSSPTYRIYQPSASNSLMPSGTGSLSLADTKNVENVTNNAGTIRVTITGHGFITNDRITVASVGGATEANGTFTITRITADTFDLNGSTYGGSYTSGGTASVTGLYKAQHSISTANGYERGRTYTVAVTYLVSSSAYPRLYTFTVV